MHHQIGILPQHCHGAQIGDTYGVGPDMREPFQLRLCRAAVGVTDDSGQTERRLLMLFANKRKYFFIVGTLKTFPMKTFAADHDPVRSRTKRRCSLIQSIDFYDQFQCVRQFYCWRQLRQCQCSVERRSLKWPQTFSFQRFDTAAARVVDFG